MESANGREQSLVLRQDTAEVRFLAGVETIAIFVQDVRKLGVNIGDLLWGESLQRFGLLPLGRRGRSGGVRREQSCGTQDRGCANRGFAAELPARDLLRKCLGCRRW